MWWEGGDAGDDARPSSNDAVGCSKDGIEEADAGDENDGEPSCEVVNHCSPPLTLRARLPRMVGSDIVSSVSPSLIPDGVRLPTCSSLALWLPKLVSLLQFRESESFRWEIRDRDND